MNEIKDLEKYFSEKGWITVKLTDIEPVYTAREVLTKELRKITGNNKITLEKYHEIAVEDTIHTQWQIHMTNFFRQQKFGFKIIAAQLDFFRKLLGPDLKVQTNPYLRITRPYKPQDNIGYHRDTFYGGSPFELSILVPYVNVPIESAVSVLSGSHIRPESDFPTTQIQNLEVTKGSPRHQLGFLYAPKLIAPACTTNMQPVPLAVGEVLIFSLSTVHGSVENHGQTSRWSSDIRVMNALAPVDLSMRPDYYETLSHSVVTEQAINYFNAQSTPFAQV